MALACDIRIASEHLLFGLSAGTRAIIIGSGWVYNGCRGSSCSTQRWSCRRDWRQARRAHGVPHGLVTIMSSWRDHR